MELSPLIALPIRFGASTLRTLLGSLCFFGVLSPSLRVAVAQTAHLSPDTAPLVEVTAESERPHPAAPPKDRSVSGSVIDGERLKQPGASTAHVLREAPGVQVTEVGGLGAPATASIRGATAAQTPVYLGGVRLNDEVGGAANLADLPLFLVDRIEVYRSHAPLVVDQLGVGGAVIVEPRAPSQDEFTIGTELGSYGTRSGYLYGGMVSGERGLLAGMKLSAAENDYSYFDDRGTLFTSSDDSRGRLQNADSELADVWLMFNDALPLSSGSPARISVIYHHGDRDQGAPKLALVPSRQARVSHRRDLFSLTSAIPVKSWDGELALSTQAIAAESVIDDPLTELGGLALQTRTPGERVEQTAQASQRVGERLRLVEKVGVAIDRLRRLERHTGVLEPELTARRASSRLAVAAEYGATDSLFVGATGAISCVGTSLGALEVCDAVRDSGRLSLSYRKRSVELYGNLGRYHRDPTLSELYGASLLVRGEEELLPEVGVSAEVGARAQVMEHGRRPQLFFDVAAFARDSDQLITYVRTAQGYIQPINRDRSRTLGAEALIGAEPTPWFATSAQVSLLDARDTSPDRMTTNEVLPFSSRLVASWLATVRYEFSRHESSRQGSSRHDFSQSVVNEAGVTGKWIHQSSRYADPAGLGVIPEQSSVDLELWLSTLGRHLMTRARVANLFDQRRFDVVGFPLPGRSAFLSMEATW